MITIQVTDKDKQEQTLSAYGMDLKLTIYYNPISKGWQIDLYDNDKEQVICLREGLTILSPALITKSLPFVVSVIPNNRPYKMPESKSDLIDNFSIHFLSKDEYFSLI